MSKTDILRTLSDAIGKIRIKSVTDNLIRFILVLVLFVIVAALFGVKEWLIIFLCVLLALSFLVFVYAYIYFSVKNPDYLRSEDYHIRKQSIEMLGDKEHYLPVDLGNIRVIANPYDEAKAIETHPIEEEEVEDE